MNEMKKHKPLDTYNTLLKEKNLHIGNNIE